MFLKHGLQNDNEIRMVAPTGFEPVFTVRHALSQLSTRLTWCLVNSCGHGTKTRTPCSFFRRPGPYPPALRNMRPRPDHAPDCDSLPKCSNIKNDWRRGCRLVKVQEAQ